MLRTRPAHRNLTADRWAQPNLTPLDEGLYAPAALAAILVGETGSHTTTVKPGLLGGSWACCSARDGGKLLGSSADHVFGLRRRRQLLATTTNRPAGASITSPGWAPGPVYQVAVSLPQRGDVLYGTARRVGGQDGIDSDWNSDANIPTGRSQVSR